MIEDYYFKRDKYSTSKISWKKVDNITEIWIKDKIIKLFKIYFYIKLVKQRNYKLINSRVFKIVDESNKNFILSERNSSDKYNPFLIEEVFYKNKYYSIIKFIEGDHYNGTLSHLKILSNDLPKKIFLYKYEKNCENKINYNDVIFKFHNFSNLYEEKYDQILKKNYNHELNLGFYAKEVINGNTFKLKNTSRKYFLNIDLHPHNVIINKAEKRAFIVDHGSYSFLNPEIAIGFHLFKILRHTYYKNKTVKDSSVIKILKNYLKNINQQIDSNEVSFELGYLLNLATLEIFRRIIFILDEYFDRNCKLWESEIVMHSFALLENKFIQNKLS